MNNKLHTDACVSLRNSLSNSLFRCLSSKRMSEGQVRSERVTEGGRGWRFGGVVFFLLFSFSLNAQVLTAPYFCGFEDPAENADWVLNNATSAVQNNPNFHRNQWTISTGAHKTGFNGLYIYSNNTPNKSEYDGGIGMYVVAYRDFALPVGQYDLTFNWRALGDSIADALYACWVPSTTPNIYSQMSTAMPAWANTYGLTNMKTGKKFMNGKASWQQAAASLNVQSGAAFYRLVFLWKNNNVDTFNPGACIDNVSITKKPLTSDCWKTPDNVTVTSGTTDLTVSWTSVPGATYEVVYFLEGAPQTDTISGITGNSVNIPLSQLNSGLYTFWVRAVCPPDNVSAWVEVSNVKVVNLDGLTLNPQACPEVSFSVSEFDTVSGVKIIRPDCGGQSYTLRPKIGAMGGSIAGYSVLPIPFDPPFPIGPVPGQTTQLFTNAVDDSWSQPVQLPFNFCFFGNTYKQAMIGANGCISFNPANAGQGCPYNIQNEPDIPSPLFNPTSAAGPPVIPYSMRNSIMGVFEDIYPVMGSMGAGAGIYAGILGEYPCRTLTVSYKDIPPFLQLSLKNSYQIVLYEGSNVIDVYVEERHRPSTGGGRGIIGLMDETGTDGVAAPERNSTDPLWNITTAAQREAWRFIPISTPVYDITWYSGFGKDGQVIGKADTLMVTEKSSGVDTVTVRLQFSACSGEYFDLLDTAIIVWDKIDTIYTSASICKGNVYKDKYFQVSDSGIYEKTLTNIRGCDSLFYKLDLTVQEYELKDTTVVLCGGQSFTYRGQTFQKTGHYPFVERYVTGCDSLRDTLRLTIYDPITISIGKTDAIQGPNSGSITINGLPADCYYTINGEKNGDLTNLPVGTYTIIAYNEYGCQSNPQTIQIVTECLEMEIDTTNLIACADESRILLPYRVVAGYPGSYSVIYDLSTQNGNFVNIIDAPVLQSGEVALQFPSDVTPGAYQADIEFKDVNCRDTTVTVKFYILYPDSIITQRWNDVLSVRNKNYNGGYEFSGYQWFKNGQAIEGATQSYLYVPEGLDFSSEYTVNLLREPDKQWAMSCGVFPERLSDGGIMVYPTFVKKGQKMTVNMPKAGNMVFYDIMGVELYNMIIQEGENIVSVPERQGVYILKVLVNDGREKTYQIICE